MKKLGIILLILITFSTLGFQAFQNLGQEHIKLWDEARGANNAIEMLENGNYWVVTFDGEPDHWNTKTPFFIWLKVLSYRFFGINEFSVRFPSALFVIILSIFILYFASKHLKNIYVGLIATLILVNTKGFIGYHVGRYGEPDAMLTAFIFFYSTMWFLLIEKYPLKRRMYYALFGIGLVLAIYSKNIAGIAPLAGIAIYSLLKIKRTLLVLSDFRFYLTIFLILLVSSFLYVTRELYDPGYIKLIYNREIYGMFFDYICGVPKHPEFNFYFLYLINNAFQTYIIFIPIGLSVYFLIKNESTKKFLLFNYIVSFCLILGYSFSGAKNEWYIAPVFPFFAMIVSITCIEIIAFVKRKLSNKLLRSGINGVLILSLTLLVFIKGKEVYRKNQPTQGEKIYEMERPGHYMRILKNKYPEIKNFLILTSFEQRPDYPDLDQIKFYAKMFRNRDKTIVTINDKVNDKIQNKIVLTCEAKYKFEIEKNFNFTILFKDELATIYRIKHSY